MPSYGKEEVANHLSETYTVKQHKSEQIRQERDTLMQGRIFSGLKPDEQFQFCRLNKALMGSYWDCFECAREGGDYKTAAENFALAFAMGFEKAFDLYKKKNSTHTPLEEKLIPSPYSAENFYTGLRYQLGLGLPKNHEEAVRWYRIAAEQGNAFAQNHLGLVYDHGIGVKQDTKEAVRWYKMAAKQGNAAAQNDLGYSYEYGIGVDKNEKEAVRWYRMAAAQGNADAQNNLGYSYEHGIGVDKDEKEAVRWYRMAAAQGNANAQNNLGFAYSYGMGVKQDAEEAVRWYRRAAKQGDVSAQNNLGHFYDHGIGVKQDAEEAVRWYRMAAEQGNATAQNNLGFAYEYGEGIDKDEKEAVRWYRMAAEQGNATALDNLKRIGTPLALYTSALIEKNSTEIINLALKHDELHFQLFEKDFVGIVSREEDQKAMSSTLIALQETVRPLNKNPNLLLINALLALSKNIEKGLIERNENIAALMTDLLQITSFADADAGQIKPLMHLLCDFYYEDNTQDILESLITLWHRAQALKVPISDFGLNKLFASIVIKRYFTNGEYSLTLDAHITDALMHALVFAYQAKPGLSADGLNTLLGENLLTVSKENLNQSKGLLAWMGKSPAVKQEEATHYIASVSP
ncbi:SEL1-like repeat protein [Legionella israelensis]|uniref:SEL1-like repeat protein n=1 Tax=Legionella israelensis TaxID=454 RepID=UPI001C8F7F45|nr:tetratricopeptide repeat protein [Legionella israelensis]